MHNWKFVLVSINVFSIRKFEKQIFIQIALVPSVTAEILYQFGDFNKCEKILKTQILNLFKYFFLKLLKVFLEFYLLCTKKWKIPLLRDQETYWAINGSRIEPCEVSNKWVSQQSVDKQNYWKSIKSIRLSNINLTSEWLNFQSTVTLYDTRNTRFSFTLMNN